LYGPILWLGILLGPDLCSCILRAPHFCSRISRDLCSGILHGPDLSLLLHVPDLCPGILYDLRPCIFFLYRLYVLDRRPCIFLGRPSLELI